VSAIDCLLIDLDDTIYPEAEYFRVIFDEVYHGKFLCLKVQKKELL